MADQGASGSVSRQHHHIALHTPSLLPYCTLQLHPQNCGMGFVILLFCFFAHSWWAARNFGSMSPEHGANELGAGRHGSQVSLKPVCQRLKESDSLVKAYKSSSLWFKHENIGSLAWGDPKEVGRGLAGIREERSLIGCVPTTPNQWRGVAWATFLVWHKCLICWWWC